MSRRRLTRFYFNGGFRRLVDADGSPTARQLQRLNHLGLLSLRTRPVAPITKAEAAWTLNEALDPHGHEEDAA